MKRKLLVKDFAAIHNLCLLELYYVAGQMHSMGSLVTPKILVDEFLVFWDHRDFKI